MAFLYISHDIDLVRCVSDRIAVMRHGRIVETGPGEQLMEELQHPYTQQLVLAFKTFRE